MPETFDRRLTVQPRLGQPAAFTAALMLHGVAVAGLLLAQPAPRPAPPLDVAVEVILSMPALPEDAPEAPPVGVPLSVASADPAEDRHADAQPDAAVWQEPPRDAGSVPATPVAEASATDTGPAPLPEPAGAWTAEPLPAAAVPRDPPPAMQPAAAVAEPAPNVVPAAVQAPAQSQPRPAPLPVSAPRPIRPSRAPVQPPPPGTAQAPHLLPERLGPPASATGSLAAAASTVPLGARPARNADHEAALEARIRDAVQAAVHYPAAARMMSLTGRARVQLDYRSGTANPALVQSAGVQMLDDAALSAARTAHYPPPPPDVGDRLLRLLVWVEFKPG